MLILAKMNVDRWVPDKWVPREGEGESGFEVEKNKILEMEWYIYLGGTAFRG